MPGIAAASKDPANPLSNTAIVFVDSKTDSSHPPIPDRVREFYFDKSEFSKMLAEEIIPHYSSKLGVTDHERCILAGHSLAGYPVMDVAANHSDTIGGVILISPAFNQKQEVLPDHADKNDTLKSLPILFSNRTA